MSVSYGKLHGISGLSSQQNKPNRKQRRIMEREQQKKQKEQKKKKQAKALMEENSQTNYRCVWLCCPNCGSKDVHYFSNNSYKCDNCNSVHHVTRLKVSKTEPDH